MSYLSDPAGNKLAQHKGRLLIALSLVCLLAAGGACTGGEDSAVDTSPGTPAQAGSLASNLRRVEGETGFYVDSLNGKAPDNKRTSPVLIDAKILPAFGIGGWANDQQAQREAGGVVVTIDGKVDIPMTYGNERPDVAKFLKSSNYLRSGFTGAISTANLEPGVHTLTFKVLTADKTGYYAPKEEIKIEIQK